MAAFFLKKKKEVTETVEEPQKTVEAAKKEAETVNTEPPATIVCPACGREINKKTAEKNKYVCYECGNYFRVRTKNRIRMVADKDTFEPWFEELESKNPLDFPGYPEKIKAAQEKTGLHEAVTVGKCRIYGLETVIGVCDARFMMSSMGHVVGEKIALAVERATELSLPVIVCLNKVDRPEARPNEVVDEVLELFMDLDASDEQLDCPFLFASARDGYAVREIGDLVNNKKDMTPLFETIIDYIPAPEGDPDANTQVLISTIDYNEYVGRIGIGKVDNGCLKVNQEAVVVNHHEPDKQKKVRISKLYEFDGLNKVDVAEAKIGSIVAISGIADIHIGDTICAPENPVAIPFQKISEPTLSMNFMVNDSPLAGQEGKFITSRHLRDRLFKELNTDVSLRVEETESPDCYKVSGRGELHLSVLVENMRREGYEFAVSKAEVLYHTDENGKKTEPMEIAYVDVPDEFTGTVIDKLSQRKGELVNMKPITGGYTRLEFNIPYRGLIGYRGDFMTDTKGNGIINTMFDGYEPFRGEIAYRSTGSLIAFETGESVTYGLFSAQERGTLFIGPGEKVYSGMIIGQSSKAEDIELNVCKKKHLTNTRSSSADEALTLVPPRKLSLEQALDFIDTDELLEVTPESLRIRKRILDPTMRKRASIAKKNAMK